MTPKFTVLATRRMRVVDLGSQARRRSARPRRVDVAVLLEGPAQGRIAGVVGEHPQLDLRVVGRREQPARLPRNERLADLPALLGAHRDVLEVRVARAEPAGRRDALVERGMNAAVLGMDQLGQSVEVGALELGELAMLDQERGEGVFERQLLEHLLGRALLAAGGFLQATAASARRRAPGGAAAPS